MITCPNCGMDNAPTRAFCAVCGERLPSEPQATVQDPSADWLRTDDAPAGNAGEPLPAWLITVEDEPAPPPAPAEPAEPPPLSSPPRAAVSRFLPNWLQGAELAPETVEPRPEDWDTDLDFSNLPGWPHDESPPPRPAVAPDLPPPLSPDDPIQSVEVEGSGLLAGVRGPIPIEPVIALPHTVPALPRTAEPPRNQAAANLFAQIAGGAVVPEPVVLPQAPPRGAALFQALLLLALLVPLLLNLPLFGAPPRLPAAQQYARTVEEVPEGATVLLAFDYEGGMQEELNPAALATLNHLRALSAAEGGRQLTLLPVSTLPLGPVLAEQLWQASEGSALTWRAARFLPGGSIGLRALVEEPISDLSPDSVALIVVFANETADVQRWIEQVGGQLPGVPMVAAVPALAETALTPFLASGQLDGLLAGLPGAVSYDYHGRGVRGPGERRLDAVTLGALVVLGVVLVGNLVALRSRDR